MVSPSLLIRGNRGKLLENCHQNVHESGYSYKKGKSRSKRLDSSFQTPKRKKMNATMRQDLLKELEEDVAELKKHISVKEKRRDQAQSMRNYKLCDEIMEEMSKSKSTLREKSNELKHLLRKDSRSKWYQKRKCNQSAGSTSCTDKESGTSSSVPPSSVSSHVISSSPTILTCRSPSPLFVPRSSAQAIDLSQGEQTPEEHPLASEVPTVSTSEQVVDSQPFRKEKVWRTCI